MPIDARTWSAPAGRSLRLFLEAGDAVRSRRSAATPKRCASSDGTSITAERRGGAALLVEPQHPRVIHLVDVVARQDDQVARVLAQDRVEVLIDRVGRALIPVLADALLRRQDLDELAELVGDDAPAHADVAVERQRLVLRRDEDPPQSGIDAVAEREIDDPVRPAEIDRRLRALLRQRDTAARRRLRPARSRGCRRAAPTWRSASSQHDARRCAVARRRCAAAGSTFRTCPARLAQVQPFDDDGAAAEQDVVRGRARLLELLDRQVVHAEHFDALLDQVARRRPPSRRVVLRETPCCSTGAEFGVLRSTRRSSRRPAAAQVLGRRCRRGG